MSTIEHRLVIAKKVDLAIKSLQENKGKIQSFILIAVQETEDVEEQCLTRCHVKAGSFWEQIGMLEDFKNDMMNGN